MLETDEREVRKPGNVLINADTDRQWYKRAIIYELHVRSFHDSNADGIGDFRGLAQKLDYLQDLGVTAIWLLPFYPSPLRDDGYDIADYYSINPIYGTLDDFKRALDEAHARGLRVITELVINHTSDQHPWFQRARRSPQGSAFRDYYVWSEDPNKYKEVRIIFKDFEPSNWTWDPIAGAYYWHRFFFHQPDLNFDNPAVHDEIQRILDFWLDMGVDGMRLDAIPYLYEREGTSSESLPETHAFLKKLRGHVDEKYGDRIFLAEANQWPEDAVTFFGEGKGDECHMAFHFPVMPRLFMSLRMEDRFPIVDILAQTPPIPETSQWAIFLRNHDELTLEMVTDEERDYMYRMYASEMRARINLGIRRRLAPLLGNDRRKIELLNLLLLSLPGTPVLYYGDEIGMGDNMFLGDRNGVRTPMQWSSDKNAGFSRSSPQALVFPVIVDPEYHYESSNVEAQERNPNSLLWWNKRILALRKQWSAFTDGTFEFLHPGNRKVLAFLRQTPEETILIIANLSRFAQPVELNLARFKDSIPVELFGRSRFPEITDKPYLLTLSPYAAFWLSIAPKETARAIDLNTLPRISIRADWIEALSPASHRVIERRLPVFLREQSWFLGRGFTVSSARIRESVRVADDTAFCLVNVDYNEIDAEDYLVPLSYAHGETARRIRETSPHLALAHVEDPRNGDPGLIFDASGHPAFWAHLARRLEEARSAGTSDGKIVARIDSAAPPVAPADINLDQIHTNQQSNSSASIGNWFLKLLRRIEPGVHPEIEATHLLHAAGFKNVALPVGSLSLHANDGRDCVIAIVSERIPNTRTAWEVTLDSLERFFERVIEHHLPSFQDRPHLLPHGSSVLPEGATAVLGTYLESARLMGERTADLHLALSSGMGGSDFAPEPYVPFSQRSLYQSLRNDVLRTIQQIKTHIGQFPPETLPLAEKLIASEEMIVQLLKQLYLQPLDTVRIRIHGNLHLAQILHTGKDFLFIDFEGEPHRPFGERRIKRSPLRDIAGMFRSFHQASEAGLKREIQKRSVHEQQLRELEAWTRFWREWISDIYFEAWRGRLAGTRLIPGSQAALKSLLTALLLENAFAELNTAVTRHTGTERLPIESILQILERSTLQ